MDNWVQHLINGLSLGGIYALVALGYTLVYGILKFINFAHADIYMLGAFAAYGTAHLMNGLGAPLPLTVIAVFVFAVVSAAFAGWAIERCCYHPLRHSPRLNLLITAIGVSLFLRNTVQLFFGAGPKSFPDIVTDSSLFYIGSVRVGAHSSFVIVISLLIMGGLVYLVNHTRWGLALRAVSINAETSALLGISSKRKITEAFILGSALAGLASVLVSLEYPRIDPWMGSMIGLKSFVAAVVGGIGSLPGALIGGLFMGLSEEMVTALLSSTYKDALGFALLILVLVVRPQGLMGRKLSEKV